MVPKTYYYYFGVNLKSKIKDQVPPTVWSSGSFISYNLCHVVENSLERSGNGRAVGRLWAGCGQTKATGLLGLT